MEEFLFQSHLEGCQVSEEAKSYLELLNYSDSALNTYDRHSLSSADDFENFLLRKGVFSPKALKNGVIFTGGFRAVLQLDLKESLPFSKISLTHQHYEYLVREMQLPLRAIQTSGVVGPFFWWKLNGSRTDKTLQIIFRKSDVEWKGTSRGWEMILSYSFRTKITSGYIRVKYDTSNSKGMQDYTRINTIFEDLPSWAASASHPLLLPLMFLAQQLSPENDEQQRKARKMVRSLEERLSKRYQVNSAPDFNEETHLDLYKISQELADCQCTVLWKRPQAWKNVVSRMVKATECFWDALAEEDKYPVKAELNSSILDQLEFLIIKLDNLENYAHVSSERLKLQRQVMDSIIYNLESKSNFHIAVQQGRLARLGRREGASILILTILGTIFLPGTFLSSIFSMSFFNFDSDIRHSVSPRLWIFFAIMVPFTGLVVAVWWTLVRRSDQRNEKEELETAALAKKIENTALKELRRMTGINLGTGDAV
ncbi:magnesium transport transmembrane region [Fusarium albosuccineum]|uniref:Magnesium transport transmembrane region n=1 Tax=Fusarium albosuccineum TaxID=1237068 RepID=A0A8H4LJG8_9HYPO|nr:magnesium transport transmembrane region [Fusarium albosuccineum]